MRIAFHIYHFTFRGSETAAFDYALYNRTILNNYSVIVSPINSTQPQDKNVVKKFSKYFNIFLYKDLEDLEQYCIKLKIDALYTIKYGTNDGLLLKTIPTLVHCVFTTKEPHGHTYAAVSHSVSTLQGDPGSQRNSNAKFPIVNHIIKLPNNIIGNYRKELSIPEKSIVIGRHGGADTFNITFVKDAILNVLNFRKDIYFLFAVKPMALENIEHPRIKYLQSFSDVKIKRKFINTCDAMIHACSLGESFGLSILEFSYCNKPVITWTGGFWHNQHHLNLKDKGLYYNNEEELCEILNEYDREKYKNMSWNVTEEFSPEKVMQQFKTVFLDKLQLRE